MCRIERTQGIMARGAKVGSDALAAEASSSLVSPLLQCYSCWGLWGVYLTSESPCLASARFRLPKFSGSEN